MSLNQSEIQLPLTDARTLYVDRPPDYVGQLGLAREDAWSLPINLAQVYGVAFEALSSDPIRALSFASTFGKLSVNVMLDASPTNFTLRPASQYAPPNLAEIRTKLPYALDALFAYPDLDAPLTYLLCDDVPVTAELGLIQALHVIDYAIASKQNDGQLPIVKLVGSEELARLQADNPEVLVRTYGNVRGIKDAMNIIGTAVPTSLVEKAGVSVRDLLGSTSAGTTSTQEAPKFREDVAYIGVTTAKRPHIGHGFLMAKALSEVAPGTPLLVELNDRGPRVGRAITTLALQNQLTTEEAIQDVMAGEFGPLTIEAAYKSRGENTPAELPDDFSLTASNIAYEKLFTRIEPTPGLIMTLANSDSYMASLANALKNSPSAESLFGGSGMTLVGDENNTVPVEAGGQLTAAGLVGATGLRYRAVMADSPSPLTPAELKALQAAGSTISLVPGMGLSINFEVASGTKGGVPLLEDLANYCQAQTGSQRLLLPAIRALLNESILVKGDGNSLNPNFASCDALMERFDTALAQVAAGNVPDLYVPLQTQPYLREVARDYLSPVYETYPTKGRVKAGEILGLVGLLPILGVSLSASTLDAAQSTDSAENLRKNLIPQADTNLVNSLRTANPKVFAKLLSQSLGLDPEVVGAQLFGAERTTKFAEVMAAMGYTESRLKPFLSALIQQGEIYVVN